MATDSVLNPQSAIRNQQSLSHIHLIGICGTAMAGLAAMLKSRGYTVTGSDRNIYPPMSTFLEDQEIPVRSPFAAENLSPRPDLVVVGNAISRGNAELEQVLDLRIPYTSMADTIRDFFIRNHDSIVVTGTHGKSTTASLLAWALTEAGLDPSFLVGAIPNNFGAGYRLGNGRFFILEGDEYDTAFFDKTPKFLHYLPDVVVINNVEFDHADIYSSLEEILLQFRRLVNLIPRRGLLLVGADSANAVACASKAFCAVETFGLGSSADWTARDIDDGLGETRFQVLYRQKPVARIRTGLRGGYNKLTYWERLPRDIGLASSGVFWRPPSDRFRVCVAGWRRWPSSIGFGFSTTSPTTRPLSGRRLKRYGVYIKVQG